MVEDRARREKIGSENREVEDAVKVLERASKQSRPRQEEHTGDQSYPSAGRRKDNKHQRPEGWHCMLEETEAHAERDGRIYRPKGWQIPSLVGRAGEWKG
jgi:hypothetical protein